jgi:hypothetical protein
VVLIGENGAVFASDRLVYLQMQKTASTHIARVLAAVVGGEQHQQHIRLRDGKQGRFVTASIRDPWSWYVSLWAYGCRGGGGVSGIRHRLTTPPPTTTELVRRSFRDARATRRFPSETIGAVRSEQRRQRATRIDLWQPVYTHADDVDAFRAWLRLVLDPDRAHELLEPFGRTDLRHAGGFMSFRYFWLLTDDRALLEQPGRVDSLDAIRTFDREHTVHDDMIRIEHLELDLRRVLDRAGHVLTNAQSEQLHELCDTKTNESEHRSTRDYFDDQTLELVATREAFLATKYGYEGPQ